MPGGRRNTENISGSLLLKLQGSNITRNLVFSLITLNNSFQFHIIPQTVSTLLWQDGLLHEMADPACRKALIG